MGEEARSELSFEDWALTVPETIVKGPVWQSWSYRKALYLHEMAWADCQQLWGVPLGRSLADQLLRSVGSISANIEEGYGRGIAHKEYDQFLRYSLGSAREAQGWYYRSRHLLPDSVVDKRMQLANEVIALLSSTINRRRTS